MKYKLSARVALFGFAAADAPQLKDYFAQYDIDVAAAFPQVSEFISARGKEAARGELARLDLGVAVIKCAQPGDETRFLVNGLKALCGAQIALVTDSSCPKDAAEAAGAFGAVVMPKSRDARSMADFCMQLTLLIRNARLSKMAASMGYHGKWLFFPPDAPSPSVKLHGIQLIAIGASAGGTEALLRLVLDFTDNMPAVVIVQHMPKDFVPLFVDSLNRKCAVEAREIRDGDPALPGRVYVAPGGLQTTVARAESGYVFHVRSGEKVSGHCPSVDVLFRSAAECAGAEAIGVILTGMGADGADGLLKMRRAGAWTIGQNAESCVVYGMPRAAFEIGAVSVQMPLGEIAAGIKKAIGMREAIK